ncbi:MAG: methylated-DNA--[protein]-cysteine S-methyltransferase [Thermoanaerobaculia bacterium]
MPESPAETAGNGDAAPEPVRISFPSPLGNLGVELDGETITRVVIVPKGRERSSFVPIADLKPAQRSDFLEEVVGRFSEYLAGARKRLDLDFDLRAAGDDLFARRVLKGVSKIPYGRTRTHQDIAHLVGRPDGYRQVLAVLMANPLPILVPCHRVVPSKAGAGSYIAGTKKKTWLLKLESRGVQLA